MLRLIPGRINSLQQVIARFRKAPFVAFLLALAMSCIACGDSQGGKAAAPPKLPVAQVLQDDVPIYVEMVGQTVGSLDISIRARVDGTLEGMHFTEGTEVEKDQLLYTIESRPYQAKVVEAESKLAEENAKLANARSELKRIKPLADMNAVSKSELDFAVAQESAARALVHSAEAALDFANVELSYTQIKSPIKGLIGISKAKVGDYVGKEPNPVVLNLVSQIDPINVRTTISEQEYLQVARRHRGRMKEITQRSPGDKLSDDHQPALMDLLLADGSTHDHQGQFKVINAQVNPETGTLTLEATFPNPDYILRPGQFAKIKAVGEKKMDALLVPQRAVREMQGVFQVHRLKEDNTVEVATVKPGERIDDMWIIDEGLTASDRIVVEGFQKLRPGVAIEPQEYNSTAAKDSVEKAAE